MKTKGVEDRGNHLDEAQYKARLAGVFDRSAPGYDRSGPRIFTYFGRRLVEVAGLSGGARVLDAATGRGAALFPAAAQVHPGGSVVGIDLSAGMVRNTAAEIEARGLRDAEVVQMDAEQLAFVAGSFDAVLCGFSIFFFLQPEAALRDFRRVLKPGGLLGLTTFKEFITGEWEWLADLLETYSQFEAELDSGIDEEYHDEVDLQTVQGLEQLLFRAGFKDIRMFSETRTFRYRDEDEWWRVLWSLWMRDFLERLEKRLGTEGLNEFKHDAYSKLAQIKTEGGIPQEFPVLFTLARRS